MTEITMKDLLEAGVHFGHQTRRWNPKMRRFIFLERNGIHILDLQKTMKCLDEARAAIGTIVRDGGKVLFVGTKKQAKETIAEQAGRCGMFWVTERWLGGTLTNFRTIRSNIQRLKEIEQMQKDGTMEKLSKKEAAAAEKERARLEKCFSGIKEMGGLPQLMFVVDTKREKIAVAEANRLRIPIVAVVDTNADPDPINYPLPGNDDAIRSIRLFAGMVSDTVMEARQTVAEGRDVTAAAEEVYHAGPEGEEGQFARVP
ncbi:MAG TPA: 30S ribosomal protein S2 [Candidatus Saccharimonadales bacterium]|nr:30S ribosomal protein S2 [Candidatus Saccharimonadales bacterium]